MTRANKLVYFLTFSIWMSSCLLAQAQISNIRFKNLTTKQGLSHPSVFCVLQDSKGFMWFGTKYGLNFYDGTSIRVYNKKDGLSSEYIQALHEDQNGAIWIGTFDGGLNRLDRASGKIISYKNDPEKPTSISSNNIYAISRDKHNNIWIGTFGGGLCKLDSATQTFQTYQHEPNKLNSLSHNDVFSILEDKTGNIWVGTYGGGLCKFNPATSTFQTFSHNPDDPESLSRDDVYCLSEDKAGNIWVGTTGGGLCRYNPKTNRFKTYKNQPSNAYSLSSDYVVDIQEDEMGALWVATSKGGGLNRFDPITEEFHRYINNQFDVSSLSSDNLNALCLDRAGSLWIGTDGGGVGKFETQNLAFTTYISDQEETSEFVAGSVTAIYQDIWKHIWIGTFENGLYEYDPEKRKYTNYRNNQKDPNSLSSDVVKAISEDNNGYIWIGTDENGICRFDRQTGKFLTFTKESQRERNLSSNSIETIFKDSKGLLWIGTYGGGVNLFDPTNFEIIHYRQNPNNSKSLVSDNIKVIYEDRSGIIWIGTKDAGLSRFNRKTNTFTNYQNQKGQANCLLSNSITSIAEDDQGFLWIGTFDEGLCRLDPRSQSFSRFPDKSNLLDNSICGLLKDNQGRLWVSTLQGLGMLNPRTNEVKAYKAEDGLYNNTFVQWSYFKSRSGELYFGGINNFISFRPENFKESSYIAPIYLTSFNLFNTPQKLNKPISDMDVVDLLPGQNFFSFEFTLLSYLDPEKNQYAYMLEGFDQGWNYIGNRRIAPFTNLDPGEYVFRVKAADKNGVWNDRGTSIRIIVHPAWYNTWWFRSIAVIAIIGLSLTYYQRRLHQVETQKAILEELVQLRTAELLQRNEEIEAQRDSIEATNIILNSAKETIEVQNQELKSINNQLEERVEQRTEELQRAYLKLLESNQELDTFIYRASHDIRGPVARLQGLCKVALMDVADAKALEYFQMLDQTGEETNQTLVRVLRIYDIRNETVHPNQFQLLPLMEEITGSLQEKYPSIKLEMSLAKNNEFCSDAEMLKVILENIIGNAFHYSYFRDNSFVRIEVKLNTEKMLCIRITDNGRGIREDMRHKLFTMFFKGTHNSSGAGLGLYVSKIAAEKLGGQITYQTGDEGETIFEIQLPNLVSHTDAAAVIMKTKEPV
jgi:ligand-binding sensor domain-containing protein/signal transduction histidine kinase